MITYKGVIKQITLFCLVCRNPKSRNPSNNFSISLREEFHITSNQIGHNCFVLKFCNISKHRNRRYYVRGLDFTLPVYLIFSGGGGVQQVWCEHCPKQHQSSYHMNIHYNFFFNSEKVQLITIYTRRGSRGGGSRLSLEN